MFSMLIEREAEFENKWKVVSPVFRTYSPKIMRVVLILTAERHTEKAATILLSITVKKMCPLIV